MPRSNISEVVRERKGVEALDSLHRDVDPTSLGHGMQLGELLADTSRRPESAISGVTDTLTRLRQYGEEFGDPAEVKKDLDNPDFVLGAVIGVVNQLRELRLNPEVEQ